MTDFTVLKKNNPWFQQELLEVLKLAVPAVTAGFRWRVTAVLFSSC